MSAPIPELGELGARLAAAGAVQERQTDLRRLSRPSLVVAFLLVLAVPAVATRGLWVPLIGGETAVPPQATIRTVVAAGTGDGGPWRVEGYRARLRAGGLGSCLFVTAGGSGAGSCLPPGRRAFVAVHNAGSVTFVLAGVSDDTEGVTASWADGQRRRANARTVTLRDGSRLRFALVQRSGGLARPTALVSVKSTTKRGAG